MPTLQLLKSKEVREVQPLNTSPILSTLLVSQPSIFTEFKEVQPLNVALKAVIVVQLLKSKEVREEQLLNI